MQSGIRDHKAGRWSRIMDNRQGVQPSGSSRARGSRYPTCAPSAHKRGRRGRLYAAAWEWIGRLTGEDRGGEEDFESQVHSETIK